MSSEVVQLHVEIICEIKQTLWRGESSQGSFKCGSQWLGWWVFLAVVLTNFKLERWICSGLTQTELETEVSSTCGQVLLLWCYCWGTDACRRRNGAVSLEKERDGEIGVICEWENKDKGCFNQGRGVAVPPWIHLVTCLNLYIRKIQRVWQWICKTTLFQVVQLVTHCETTVAAAPCDVCSAGSNALCLWQLVLWMLSDVGWPFSKLCLSSSGKMKSQTCLCES